MVKIHLTKRVAGPEGNFGPGATIEVEPGRADALVSAGAAERIDGMIPYRPEADAAPKAKRETATEKPVGKREKAVEQ